MSAGQPHNSTRASGSGEAAAPSGWDGGSGVGQYLAEEIHAAGAMVLGAFTAGRLASRTALTTSTYGSGAAYDVVTIPNDHGM